MASFVIRGCSIGVSLLLVPLTIDYVNPTRYGIWLTLSSIVGWFSFFDVGLTQGLRNKFAEAKAKGDDVTAQIYVSTTFAILSAIFTCVWLVFIGVNRFVDWAAILHVPASMGTELTMLTVIVFTYFCLQFVLRIITTIIIADQQPAKSSLIDVLGQVGSLLIVFLLVRLTQGSLINLGVALCMAPLLILIGANFYFFKGVYKRYRPSFSKIKLSYAKGLLNLGLVFFVIQVAGIIQYQSANFIIASNFSPLDVTSYNIVYRYFGILSMVFAIFLNPFWSASTEAYLKKDIQWIKNGIRKYNLLNIALAAVGAVMLFYSEEIYTLWLGKDTVDIAFTLSVWGFIYFNMSMFGGKYVSFLNGISALRIQFLASLASPVLYVVIVLVLIKYYHVGVHAVFIAAILANLNAYLLAPWQYHQIINRNKKGIWVR
ncbi:MATE family efflux transporter [uncultured Pontibacter sp.]|uniref:MATE family efflux transporter n=1 Tax=uncultured Pontibacter sp. TaxID=453356 RepID=UPI00261AA244|nr:MATE family efflux transporter [uncultured Pontibacter sp.]